MSQASSSPQSSPRWEINPPAPEDYINTVGYPRLIAQLLYNRNIKAEQVAGFVDPAQFTTQSPFVLPGVTEAVARIRKAIDSEEIIDIKEQALEAVSAGYYPSPPARDLNLVTKGSPQGLVREFISWILSEGQIYVKEAGFIPISQDKLEKEILKLDE